MLRRSRSPARHRVTYFASLSTGPSVGSAVAALGYPLGLPLSISQGIVRRVFRDYGIPTLAARIVIEGGNSGGPIINSRGEAVGLVSRVFPVANPNRDGPNLNGGIDFSRWWGNAAERDLCLTHPAAGVPGCDEATGETTALANVPIDLPPRH